jgi:hypothetical protein
MIRCVQGYFVLLARLTLAKRVRGLYQLRVSSRSPRVGSSQRYEGDAQRSTRRW